MFRTEAADHYSSGRLLVQIEARRSVQNHARVSQSQGGMMTNGGWGLHSEWCRTNHARCLHHNPLHHDPMRRKLKKILALIEQRGEMGVTGNISEFQRGKR